MKFDPDPVVKKARDTISRYKMSESGDKVLVGVSGGADSLALFFILHKLAPSLGIELSIFHLDHMMRGDKSGEDAAFVRRLAGAMKVPAIIERYDVAKFVKKHKLSPEDGARQVRYKMMREAASRIDAQRIAVGHTADDQVETYLMRMIRGSGLNGLRGIPPVNGPVIRPLIAVWREETIAYCRSLGMEPRVDETNEDASYLRNRIRNKLIPLIEQDYNRGFKEEALREIDVIDTDLDLIEAIVEESVQETVRIEGRKVELDRDLFLDLHPALKRRVLRTAIEALKGDLQDITSTNVEDVIRKVVCGNSGGRLELPGGLTVHRLYDIICIEFSSDFHNVVRVVDKPMKLKVPGTTRGKGPGFFIRAEILEHDNVVVTPGEDTAYIDAGKIAGGLTVRPVAEGDRFRPLGMKGTKKVQDFFTDLKVGRKEREKALVVEANGKLVWLVGYRLDDGFKVTESTDKVLILIVGKE